MTIFGVLVRYRRGAARRAAIADMRRMSNEALRDIGITRAEIPAFIEGCLAQDAVAGCCNAPGAPRVAFRAGLCCPAG